MKGLVERLEALVEDYVTLTATSGNRYTMERKDARKFLDKVGVPATEVKAYTSGERKVRPEQEQYIGRKPDAKAGDAKPAKPVNTAKIEKEINALVAKLAKGTDGASMARDAATGDTSADDALQGMAPDLADAALAMPEGKKLLDLAKQVGMSVRAVKETLADEIYNVESKALRKK